MDADDLEASKRRFSYKFFYVSVSRLSLSRVSVWIMMATVSFKLLFAPFLFSFSRHGLKVVQVISEPPMKKKNPALFFL